MGSRIACNGDVRNVEEHFIVALQISVSFDISRAATFDLDTTSRFLLDVLNIRAARTDYLGSKVETWDRLQTNGDALFRPLVALR